MDKKIAFFVDGGYFIKRVEFFRRKYFAEYELNAKHIISLLYRLISRHQDALNRSELYRIYYYDAPPFDGQMREPVPRNGHTGLSTKSFKQDNRTLIQKDLHSKLGRCRKLAMRMGELANTKEWIMNNQAQSDLLKGDITIDDLRPEHFYLKLQQKGVDTRIGIDIATLTLNQFADTIVLIASDADFVPAAKLARTHGVDVVLDPLFGNVANELCKHIDGKRSFDLVSLIAALSSEKPQPTPNWWVE